MDTFSLLFFTSVICFSFRMWCLITISWYKHKVRVLHKMFTGNIYYIEHVLDSNAQYSLLITIYPQHTYILGTYVQVTGTCFVQILFLSKYLLFKYLVHTGYISDTYRLCIILKGYVHAGYIQRYFYGLYRVHVRCQFFIVNLLVSFHTYRAHVYYLQSMFWYVLNNVHISYPQGNMQGTCED